MSEKKSRREIALLAAGGLVGTVLATTASRPAKAVGSGQPKMEQARQFLEQALRALDEAANDKGGYKFAAMKKVREAIDQVDAGMRYSATH
jgi:hypothetical protein